MLAIMEFHLFIMLAILCGSTYEQGLQSCWLKSCEQIANIETYATTMIEKQDNMTNMMSDGPGVAMFADVESNITATLGNKIDASELKLMNVVSDKTNEIFSAVNASVSDIDTMIYEKIVMELNNTESNLVSAMSNQIVTAEANIISALENKTDEVTASINMDISDSVQEINETITSTVAKSEAHILDSLASNITSSESNIIGALTDNTDDFLAFLNSNISDAVSNINEAIANKVSTSERNIVSEIVAELNGTSTDILTAMKAEIEATHQNLSMKIDELAAIVSSLQPPVVSGYTVGSTVKEIHVELDVFSGVANPSWTVTEVSSHWASLVTSLGGTTSTSLPSRLGYRGFIVTSLLQDGTSVTQMFGHAQQSSSTLETILLNSNDGAIPAILESVVTATINGLAIPDIGGPQSPLGPDSLPNFNPKCGTSRACVEPDFDPSRWTTTSDNSYNYALQLPTGTYAQPGRYHGEMYTDITGEDIRRAALHDKLVDMNDTDVGVFPNEDNNCLITLVIIPGMDFHFLRRDSDGTWSHKPGPRDPINVDNAGQPIFDPRTADIAPYKFVRFLAVCPRKVDIN